MAFKDDFTKNKFSHIKGKCCVYAVCLYFDSLVANRKLYMKYVLLMVKNLKLLAVTGGTRRDRATPCSKGVSSATLWSMSTVEGRATVKGGGGGSHLRS
jgi:hypothetical protein